MPKILNSRIEIKQRLSFWSTVLCTVFGCHVYLAFHILLIFKVIWKIFLKIYIVSPKSFIFDLSMHYDLCVCARNHMKTYNHDDALIKWSLQWIWSLCIYADYGKGEISLCQVTCQKWSRDVSFCLSVICRMKSSM